MSSIRATRSSSSKKKCSIGSLSGWHLRGVRMCLLLLVSIITALQGGHDFAAAVHRDGTTMRWQTSVLRHGRADCPRNWTGEGDDAAR